MRKKRGCFLFQLNSAQSDLPTQFCDDSNSIDKPTLVYCYLRKNYNTSTHSDQIGHSLDYTTARTRYKQFCTIIITII